MTLQEATYILEHYNKWRRGEVDELIYTPAQIGIALDIVIQNVKNQKR